MADQNQYNLKNIMGIASERPRSNFVIDPNRVPKIPPKIPPNKKQPSRSPANVKMGYQGNKAFLTSDNMSLSAGVVSEEESDIQYALGRIKDNADFSKMTREGNIRDMMDQQMRLLQNTNAQMDLTPIAAFVDNMTGSNFAKTYHAPQQAQNTLQTVQMLKQAIAKEKSGMVQDDLKATSTKLSALMQREKNKADILTAQTGLGIKAEMLAQKAKEKKALDKLKKSDRDDLTALLSAQNLFTEALDYAEENKDLFGSIRSKLDWNVLSDPLAKGNALYEWKLRRDQMKKKLLLLTAKFGKSLENRLTDADIVRYKEIVGSLEQNPESVITGLRDLKKQTENNYRRHYTQLVGQQYTMAGFDSPNNMNQQGSGNSGNRGKKGQPEKGVIDYTKMKKEDVMARIRASRKKK